MNERNDRNDEKKLIDDDDVSFGWDENHKNIFLAQKDMFGRGVLQQKEARNRIGAPWQAAVRAKGKA